MGPLEYLLEAWSRVRGHYPVTMAGRTYKCDPDHISFWSKMKDNSWEPETFAVLDKLLDTHSVYCDIGAWIGPTVLHAATRCSQVYCLEPDRVAYMYLLRNLQLNKLDNVLPFNLALSDVTEVCSMASPRGKRGDSMTSLLRPDGPKAMQVVCVGWQNWLELAGYPVFDAVKMDIEGGEFMLLPAMANYLAEYRPGLYLSLHPHLLPESKRQQAMRSAVDVLKVYGRVSSVHGEEVLLESLMEEQAVNQAGSYLLLP